jgi:predicted nucleotidyltransferase component of viral defense system
MRLPALEDFYLVGGTALALQIGHRKSVDLDFFCDSDHDQDKIFDELPEPKSKFALNRVFLGVHIDGVKCDFVRHSFPRIQPLVIEEGVRMASLLEIAAMKLWAITRRGAKKDFADLFYLLKSYSLEEMFAFFSEKYPSVEPFMVLRSLTFFGDAEMDLDPDMLEDIGWEEMRNGIVKAIQEFAKKQ